MSFDPSMAPRRKRIHHTSHSARMITPAAVTWQPTTCQWPFGEVGATGFRFCGAPVTAADGEPCTDGRPYCLEHMDVAYEPRADRRSEPAIAD